MAELEKDTRTGFQKWLQGIGASAESRKQMMSAQANMATGADGLPGTSPVSQAFGFFTDSPEQATARAAAVEQSRQVDWGALREGMLQDILAANEARYAPASTPGEMPSRDYPTFTRTDGGAAGYTAPVASTAPVSVAGAFGQNISGRTDLRMPDEYTPQQLRALEIASALEGLTAGQFQTLMQGVPGPAAQPSQQEMARADARAMAMSRYAPVLQDPNALREEKEAAMDAMQIINVILSGGDPLALRLTGK
jgi:hypothetical protein